MRSKIVDNVDKDNSERYSDLQVLMNNGRYYIGTLYENPDGYMEPGSRDSVEYYAVKADADAALANGTFTQREMP